MFSFNKTPIIKESKEDKVTLNTCDLNIVFDGDSLTWGILGGQTYPLYVKNKLTSVVNSITYNSFGVGGQSTLEMIADASTQIDTLVNVSKNNVLVAWEDVNAILNDERTGAENYADFITYFTDRKTAGFDYCVLVIGYHARIRENETYNNISWTQTRFDEQEIYRELVRNATSPPWDIVVDLTTNPLIGGDAGQYVNNYFTDSVHLTEEGYNVVGDWILHNGVMNNFK